MNVRELTIVGQPDGGTVVYIRTEDGETERLRTGSQGDHDVIRHGELVGQDWDPDARIAVIEAQERREAADGD